MSLSLQGSPLRCPFHYNHGIHPRLLSQPQQDPRSRPLSRQEPSLSQHLLDRASSKSGPGGQAAMLLAARSG